MQSLFWMSLREELTDLRRKIWNKRFKLWWYRLYIRRDEFHRSLNSDFDAMLVMDRYELEKYFNDLYRRRKIAHRRDMHRRMKKGIMSILQMRRGAK
jgi:hypothetical protein